MTNLFDKFYQKKIKMYTEANYTPQQMTQTTQQAPVTQQTQPMQQQTATTNPPANTQTQKTAPTQTKPANSPVDVNKIANDIAGLTPEQLKQVEQLVMKTKQAPQATTQQTQNNVKV